MKPDNLPAAQAEGKVPNPAVFRKDEDESSLRIRRDAQFLLCKG